MKNFSLLLLLIAMARCTFHHLEVKPLTPIPQTAIDTSWVSVFDPRTLKGSHVFDSGRVIGQIESQSLDEVSGMASSYATPKSFWMEEDSGNPNIISLLSTEGKLLGDISIEHVANRDWEDMSISSGPTDKVHYFYLADIGDNDKTYETKYVYRFVEPTVSSGSAPFHNSLGSFDIISFYFPDGIKNSEAIMIDPLTKDFFVISKESDKAVIYAARYPQLITTRFILEKIGTLPISKVTAADISGDGTEILIKNYTQVFYWKRNAGQSISSTLHKTPFAIPYKIEQQGESICFASDGSGFYTASEKIDTSAVAIYFYKRN
jgi:hypothetical protein